MTKLARRCTKREAIVATVRHRDFLVGRNSSKWSRSRWRRMAAAGMMSYSIYSSGQREVRSASEKEARRDEKRGERGNISADKGTTGRIRGDQGGSSGAGAVSRPTREDCLSALWDSVWE